MKNLEAKTSEKHNRRGSLKQLNLSQILKRMQPKPLKSTADNAAVNITNSDMVQRFLNNQSKKLLSHFFGVNSSGKNTRQSRRPQFKLKRLKLNLSVSKKTPVETKFEYSKSEHESF